MNEDSKAKLADMQAYFADLGFTDLNYETRGPFTACYSDLHGMYVTLNPEESRVEITAIDGMLKTSTGELSWPNDNIPTFLRKMHRHRPADVLGQTPKPDQGMTAKLAEKQKQVDTLVTAIKRVCSGAGINAIDEDKVGGHQLTRMLNDLAFFARTGREALRKQAPDHPMLADPPTETMGERQATSRMQRQGQGAEPDPLTYQMSAGDEENEGHSPGMSS